LKDLLASATTFAKTHTLLGALACLAVAAAGIARSLRLLKTSSLLHATTTETGTTATLGKTLGLNIDTVSLTILSSLVIKTAIAALVYLALAALDHNLGRLRDLTGLTTLHSTTLAFSAFSKKKFEHTHNLYLIYSLEKNFFLNYNFNKF
tara:strand:- start:8775 stop:9224 length:450 start_codon:yes stop_codon:yes gene_type:complete